MFWIASYIVGLLIMLAVMPWIAARHPKHNRMPVSSGWWIAVFWPISVVILILATLAYLYEEMWDRIVKGA